MLKRKNEDTEREAQFSCLCLLPRQHVQIMTYVLHCEAVFIIYLMNNVEKLGCRIFLFVNHLSHLIIQKQALSHDILKYKPYFHYISIKMNYITVHGFGIIKIV